MERTGRGVRETKTTTLERRERGRREAQAEDGRAYRARKDRRRKTQGKDERNGKETTGTTDDRTNRTDNRGGIGADNRGDTGTDNRRDIRRNHEDTRAVTTTSFIYSCVLTCPSTKSKAGTLHCSRICKS